MPEALPVVDLGLGPEAAGRAIDAACRTYGFFTLVGHGVDPALVESVDTEARAFFALPDATKAEIAMSRGGRAWRGWFPLGGELTSGVPDAKEGLYFGTELAAGDPRVTAGLPLHGPNLFPAMPAGLRPAVLAYLDALTALGHRVLEAMALGLGLGSTWFADHLTADPTILFRIFRYPPTTSGWGVAEHTDYGLLTLLHQDGVGGLEVHGPDGWLDVPPQPGALVCNLGDMLERMTAGAYRSTPHRVRNATTVDRLSLAFFFDPSWDAEVVPVPVGDAAPSSSRPRWDDADPLAFRGTYGAYLLDKVTKVFPALAPATGEGP